MKANTEHHEELTSSIDLIRQLWELRDQTVQIIKSAVEAEVGFFGYSVQTSSLELAVYDLETLCFSGMIDCINSIANPDKEEPEQKIGDVFKDRHHTFEWTIAAISNGICLLTGPIVNGRADFYTSERYPLDPFGWTPIK